MSQRRSATIQSMPTLDKTNINIGNFSFSRGGGGGGWSGGAKVLGKLPVPVGKGLLRLQ